MDEVFKYLLTILPPTIITGTVVFILAMKYYNTIKLVISDILILMSRPLKLISKNALSYRLEGFIESSIYRTTDNSNILPYDIKIKWEKEEIKETLIENKKVVIVLSTKDNKEHQYIRAMLEYVRVGLAPTAKLRMSTDVLAAADMKACHTFIVKGSKSAVTEFENKFLYPYINHEPSKRILYDKLKRLEDGGMLYQLVLNEFELVAKQELENLKSPELEMESLKFMDFVLAIEGKAPGENVPLCFNKTYFKVGIILAYSDYYITHEDGEANFSAYINRIQQYINMGVRKIYIYALGSKIDYAQAMAETIDTIEGRIYDIQYQTYIKSNIRHTKSTTGICIEMSVAKHIT